mmetsp:Transcript_16366/g.25304  ORF Transcript_16366/g.25304 Transcript_16366/m.25304 type:complete len:106 (+) Transcript_16366:321-638(+)
MADFHKRNARLDRLLSSEPLDLTDERKTSAVSSHFNTSLECSSIGSTAVEESGISSADPFKEFNYCPSPLSTENKDVPSTEAKSDSCPPEENKTNNTPDFEIKRE